MSSISPAVGAPQPTATAAAAATTTTTTAIGSKRSVKHAPKMISAATTTPSHKKSKLSPDKGNDDPQIVTPCADRCCSDAVAHKLLLAEADCDIHSAAHQQSRVPKRVDYISWDEYFLAVAVLSARRSKDPHRPNGCCIVDPKTKRILSIGYNGFPKGCSDDVMPWTKPAKCNGQSTTATTATPWLHTAAPYEVHAEVNAVLNKGSADVVGGILYTLRFPCNECAKVLAQAGIGEVVYLNDDDDDNVDATRKAAIHASRIILGMAQIKVRKYETVKRSDLVLNFTSTNGMENNNNNNNAVDEGIAACDDKDTVVAVQLREQHKALLLSEAQYDPSAQRSTKGNNYLSWDDYFMAMAFLTAQRSKDPNTQVGACLVDADTQRIVGLGYNGFPAGASDDILSWSRDAANPLHRKYPFVCHAELNAVLNKCRHEIRGARLYVDLFPCNECAKVLIQAGVREVVYLKDTYRDTDSCRASRVMFGLAQVKLRQHTPRIGSIRLSLEANSKTNKEQTTQPSDQ